MKWLKYLSIGAFVVGWIQKSSKDGIITTEEINELIKFILTELNLDNIKII